MSYRKSYYFHNLWKQMQKDLHLTGEEMYKRFPCIYEAREKEWLDNIAIDGKIIVNKIRRGIGI